MRHFGWAVIAVALCLAAGCADKSQANVNKADALTASGFKMVPANTPERQSALRQLPPQKVVRQVRNDKVVFVYADPVNCQTADERAMNNWDWSPWTFGFPDD